MSHGFTDFVCKGPGSKYFRLVGHLASAAATQHCHCSVKAAADDTSTDGRDSVPVKLCLQEPAVAGFALWPQSPDP